MKTHTIFNFIYRYAAIAFLLGIFSIAAIYGTLVVFYAVNSSWSAPLTLSPTQDRVLSFQPQVAQLEANLNKQRIELTTAQATVKALAAQTEQINHLITRVDGAMSTEAAQLAATGKAIDRVLIDKVIDLKQTEKSIAEAQALLKQIDAEVAAKLITGDQAVQRRISLQAALNAATDARAQAIQLEQQSRQASATANTIRGGSTSLIGISAARQIVELRAMYAQLEIQLVTATSTVEALTKSIFELERVLDVAKQSPYHRALRESVTVAFVPYDNLKNVKEGEPVYDCYLQVIACRKVGTVTKLYDAEEYARHPLFKTDLKGRMVEIEFSKPEAALSQVVFIGGKPLFL